MLSCLSCRSLQVYKSAKGRVWTGQEALGRGLVDELGGLNKAIAIAKYVDLAVRKHCRQP